MTLPVSGIYKITNMKTGKAYVGQSKNVHIRGKQHFKELRAGVHDNRLMQKEWNEDHTGFRFDVIEYCPLAELNAKEKYWIHELNTMCPNGYNLDWVKYSRSTKEPEQKVKGYHKTS